MEEENWTIELTPPFSIEQGSHIVIEITESFSIKKALLLFPIGGGWGDMDLTPFVEVTSP